MQIEVFREPYKFRSWRSRSAWGYHFGITVFYIGIMISFKSEIKYENEYNHCMCIACKSGLIHKSDCAVHNEPAERNGECNCEPIKIK